MKISNNGIKPSGASGTSSFRAGLGRILPYLFWLAMGILVLGSFARIPFLPHALFIFYPYGLLGPDNLPFVYYFNPSPLAAAAFCVLLYFKREAVARLVIKFTEWINSRPTARFFVVTFSIGIIVRLFFVFLLSSPLYADAYENHRHSLYFAGLGPQVDQGYRPAGMCMLYGTLYRIFGPTMWVSTTANIVFTAGYAFFAYILAARLLPAKWARVAFLAVLFYPEIAAYNYVPMTEMPATFFLLAAFAAVFLPRRILGFFVSGVCFGTAFSIRSTVGALGPVIVLFLIVIAWREGLRRAPRLAGLLALFIIGFALSVIPVVYWYSAEAGKLRLLPTAGERNFFFGHNRYATGKFNQYNRKGFEKEKDYQYWLRGGNKEAWDFIIKNPRREIKLSVLKVMYFFHRAEYALLHPNYLVPELVPYRGILIAFAFVFQFALILMVALVVPAFFRRDKNLLLGVAKASVVIFVIIHVVLVSMSRYRYPVLVFLILLAISTLYHYIPLKKTEAGGKGES